jgi:alkanesulfonate monooxygenase SsuD/methylene tetrahydromethanopterin reductase-like flavin-dependent oxidoreductase (luciferase family)
MTFDIFLSICQTEVDGFLPSERQMFLSFFDQIQWADQLGYKTAWVAETHLSCQVQKENADAVIPHFRGEIGLNTDILQVAHQVFAKTKEINVGSAIRNIICNGGPIAHAEAVRTFLTLHNLDSTETRKLELGFAAGRFPFSNTPYGFSPKSELEHLAWDVIKNKYFQEATEIFLRLLRGEKISSKDISQRTLSAGDFRDPELWNKVLGLTGNGEKTSNGDIKLSHHWNFDKVGVIPFDTEIKNLNLTIGSHDPEAQILANQFLPVGVFNLSITPPAVIEETHARMRKHFHPDGGPWQRRHMPRTVMLFLDADGGKAKAMAERAWKNYWTAMEKTLDPKKVASAVSNTIAGDASEVRDLIQQKYHPDDRLMLWFDFNHHDNEAVKSSMKIFMEKVALV